MPILEYLGIIRSKKLNDVQIKNLDKYSPYYRRLNSKHKREFRSRVARFIHSKEFIPRNLEVITEEMKIVVASLAIQMTFGLPEVYLSHFGKILIYPDNYYSTINNDYHKGEVNPRFGIIVLSWKNLVKGIANENDGINLGFHELAHAIHLENRIANQEYGFIDSRLWERYNDLATYEMLKIKEGGISLFRAAAAIDHHEFFAVLLENFFEKPKALKAYSPNLYKKTTLLLKQDPIKLLKL
ncbi:zinc-dependent peptidase [Marivirga sp.]|uniref:zinc-dependent peptidase n=1 Tax=Marivirga sp. TaxID=2018662 RepID=UPI002D7E7899|nr:zinc-dependent peptidase [Marivirga sp.]HET8861142.1 zinc-dependent peptidase [Marivirga sp.]